MEWDDVVYAEQEARRFLRRVEEMRKADRHVDHQCMFGSRQSASVKRASLDLTNALATMRQRERRAARIA